jgi:hypothetical protein
VARNVRTEVAHWNLDQAMVALPADKSTPLKQGRWLSPGKTCGLDCSAPPKKTSLRDESLLELPLPVVTGLPCQPEATAQIGA